MSVFDDIRELKSQNNLEGAWEIGYEALQQDKNNEFLKTSLFWVIYAAIKSVMEAVKSRQESVLKSSEQAIVDRWAARIALLQLTLPNENIDFRLWNLFSQTGKFCEPICAYILQSGRGLFKPDDHQPYVSEKGESPSTVLKLARMVAGSYLMKPRASILSAPRIVALINYAEENAQDSAAGKIWLAYDKAKLLVSAGETVKARKAFLSVLHSKRTESWAWFGLASTYRDEPDIAIKLLAEGLSFAHDPKFSVPGLLDIATLLSDTGSYESASKALNKLISIYNENGWALNDKIVNLTSQSWFDASVDFSDFASITRDLAEGANLYTVEKPKHFQGVLQNIHASGKGANIYISKDLLLSARKSLFPNKRFPNPGAPIKMLCDVSSDKPEVVSIEAIDQFDSQDIRFFSGTLRIREKGFGFVEGDIFVQASLISGLPDNCETAGIAVQSFDKVKDRYGWKAITLRRIGESAKDEDAT